MRRVLLSIILFSGLLSSYASNPSVITGTWNRAHDKEVSLFYIISGRLEELASYKLQGDSKFGFAFEPKEEGFYVIGSKLSTSAQNKYVFYFKPGDKLDVNVNDSTYVLSGKNTPENEALAKWHDNVCLMEWKSVYFNLKCGRWLQGGMPSTYVDFFPLLEEQAQKAKSYISNTGNKKFDKTFEEFRNYDLIRYATTFIQTPRTAHPQAEDFTDFYRNIDVSKLTATTNLLEYPFGIGMISTCLYIKQKLSQPDLPEEAKAKGMDISKLPAEERQKLQDSIQNNSINQIKNDTLKGEMVVRNAGILKTYNQYEEFEKKYGKYILTQDQKDRMNAILTKIAQTKPATETIDFSGTDLNDKKVSLSDFKGKVVVVDVWATWCGPCKREIPSLKAMEKDYHGKDVVFLSISVDEVKDKQKWKDFVKKEELTGVQLYGGNGMQSDVSKFYKINSIPRFLLFDKQGKIISDNSPRPSDPELAKMVDDLLKK